MADRLRTCAIADSPAGIGLPAVGPSTRPARVGLTDGVSRDAPVGDYAVPKFAMLGVPDSSAIRSGPRPATRTAGR